MMRKSQEADRIQLNIQPKRRYSDRTSLSPTLHYKICNAQRSRPDDPDHDDDRRGRRRRRFHSFIAAVGYRARGQSVPEGFTCTGTPRSSKSWIRSILKLLFSFPPVHGESLEPVAGGTYRRFIER